MKKSRKCNFSQSIGERLALDRYKKDHHYTTKHIILVLLRVVHKEVVTQGSIQGKDQDFRQYAKKAEREEVQGKSLPKLVPQIMKYKRLAAMVMEPQNNQRIQAHKIIIQ